MLRYFRTLFPNKHRASVALRPLSARASEPKLVQYDEWGRRVDDLQTSEGWRGLKAVMQQEGIPGIFFERTHGAYSRVHGFMKMLVAVGDSQVVSTLIIYVAVLANADPNRYSAH